ncbi:MAG: leucyl/phenylalanyl-tRNA--protein transferase [Saprospiraceae bacterium]|nr:leucyl/phenylalanyl-tRNA--protein transferase [Saprospiraceae bacterium]
MSVYKIPQDTLIFPHPSLGTRQGLLGIGGDLSIERILLAYSNGIFPWNNEGEEIMWWCLTPRLVLYPKEIKISKSMSTVLGKHNFEIRYDKAFEQVIDECSKISRKAQDGTWIHTQLKKSFIDLNEAGIAHSVEVWKNNEIIGGLYGLGIGRMFCGESMFAKESNMSKVALVHLCEKLINMGYEFIDCQQDTSHLRSLGARLMSKNKFFKFLESNKTVEIAKGKWE